MNRSVEDPVAVALFGDVVRYDSFGLHRTGSTGAEAALDWIAEVFSQAGLTVSQQAFTVGRQHAFERGMLGVGGCDIPTMPQWWPREDCATLSLSRRVGKGVGQFHVLELPYDQGAYLSGTQKDAILRAAAPGPAAILLCIRHPSGEIFTYNVSQADTPWPVPVVLVAPKDIAHVREGELATLELSGTWQRNVAARNIIGRSAGPEKRSIVVSTPVTSWFTSTGERAPGIACLLALARQAMTRWPRHQLVLVATSGHEVGHGGMEEFLAHEAPSPDQTDLWLHLGASLACHACEWTGGAWRAVAGSGALPRFALASDTMADLVERHARSTGATLLSGKPAAIGELREVQAAGHVRFGGMVGQNPLFHTGADRSFVTSGAILAPVLHAFEAMLDDIDSRCA